MLTLPEKALLVKLTYQDGVYATVALRSYCHRGVFGKGPMAMAGEKRIILKFEASGSLVDGPRSGQQVPMLLKLFRNKWRL